MHKFLLMVIVLFVATFAPSARAQDAGVDKVLGALADIVKSRAQRAARKHIEDRIESTLCSGKEQTIGRVQLSWGASTRQNARCESDQAFVDSCRLLEDGARLNDPYFLKKLSEDALAVLVRLAAKDMPCEQFEAKGLQHVSTFAHDAIVALSKKKASLGDLADALTALGKSLSETRSADPVLALGSDARKEAGKLYALVVNWLDQQCPDSAAEPPADDSKAASHEHLQRICKAWHAVKLDNAEQLQEETSKWFLETYEGGLEYRTCAAAFSGDSKHSVKACQIGRVLYNLRTLTAKIQCGPRSDCDRGGNSTIRQLGYVASQRLVYEDALTGQTELLRQFGAFLTAALQNVGNRTDDFAREHVADGAMVLAALVKGLLLSPKETRAWLNLLAADIEASSGIGMQSPQGRLRAVLNGQALDSRTAKKFPAVRPLRDATKDFLTRPMLQALAVERKAEISKEKAVKGTAQDKKIAKRWQAADEQASWNAGLDLMRKVALLSTRAEGDDVAEVLSGFLGGLGAETQRLGKALDDDNLCTYGQVLGGLEDPVNAIAKHEWTSLALTLSERVSAGSQNESLQRGFAFVRVLMSMYEADDVDEAKGIFENVLEDQSSREARFDDFTLDVSSILAGRGGGEWTRTTTQPDPTMPSDTKSETKTKGAIYGVLAPFGLQLAWCHVGVLFYPVDLGTYLTAAEENPRFQDAIRVGAVTFLRFQSVPLAIGGGADYRPEVKSEDALTNHDQWRAYAFLGLELPLLMIQ